MRNLFVLVTAILIVILSTFPALADRGMPGTTFPEQPGDHLARACEARAANIAAGHGVERSIGAFAIFLGLFFDAWLGLWLPAVTLACCAYTRSSACVR